MTARYQHITDAVRHDIPERVGDLIWPAETDDDAPEPGQGPLDDPN